MISPTLHKLAPRITHLINPFAVSTSLPPAHIIKSKYSHTPTTNNSIFLNHRPKYFFSTNNNLPKQALNQLLSHPYSRLCRWDKPIGALLLYWPCLWGLEAGAHGLLLAQSTSIYLSLDLFPLYLLFLMGSWTARSAGCIINDYLDKDFDKNV